MLSSLVGGGGGSGGQIAPSGGGHSSTPTLRRIKYLPNTMGWRYWTVADDGCLVSPSYQARWEGGELRTPSWSPSDAVRGVAGIHALRAPELWRYMHNDQIPIPTHPIHDSKIVTGLVERYGNYVLGEDGWRAEWVVIRELLAPNEAIAAKLRAYYPDIPVHCDEDEPKENDDGHRKGHRDRNTGVTTVSASTDDGADQSTYTRYPWPIIAGQGTGNSAAGIATLMQQAQQTREKIAYDILTGPAKKPSLWQRYLRWRKTDVSVTDSWQQAPIPLVMLVIAVLAQSASITHQLLR